MNNYKKILFISIPLLIGYYIYSKSKGKSLPKPAPVPPPTPIPNNEIYDTLNINSLDQVTDIVQKVEKDGILYSDGTYGDAIDVYAGYKDNKGRFVVMRKSNGGPDIYMMRVDDTINYYDKNGNYYFTHQFVFCESWEWYCHIFASINEDGTELKEKKLVAAWTYDKDGNKTDYTYFNI